MGCNYYVVSEIVAEMSARTSFFILMVASSVSFAFSDFSIFLSTPLSSYLFVSLVSSAGDSTMARLYPRSRSGPSLSSSSFFLSPLLPLLLLAPPGSTTSFYLGANVLIACGRSSRPTHCLPSSVSSWLLRDHRLPKSLLH